MNASLFLISCLIAVVPFAFSWVGRRQRLVVKGTLMCGNKPYPGATVKIISKRALRDSTLAEVTSDAKGQFSVDGTSQEVFDLKGEVKVYHDCDDDLPCQRRWMSKIPSDYINPAETSNPKVMDVGTVNLALRQESEERDCFH